MKRWMFFAAPVTVVLPVLFTLKFVELARPRPAVTVSIEVGAGAALAP